MQLPKLTKAEVSKAVVGQKLIIQVDDKKTGFDIVGVQFDTDRNVWILKTGERYRGDFVTAASLDETMMRRLITNGKASITVSTFFEGVRRNRVTNFYLR